MASALFDELVTRLKFDGIDIDTWVFKFYSRVTVGLFWVAAAISVADSFVDKKPIECKGDDKEYDTNYCYLHGVAHLQPNGISKEISGADCFSADNVGEEKISNYYLWISLVLFLCGAAFAIPNEIWKHFEGGVLKQFEGLKSIELEDEKENRKKAVSQFSRLSNNFTNRYFYTFVVFELAYCILGIIIFNLINVFLDGKFQSYGSDTFAYLSGNSVPISITDTKNNVMMNDVTVNPMCNVFPTVVSCTIKYFSVVQGAADTKNNICILGRNIVNQQIFLVLWVWFMILFFATVCQIIYRLITLFVPSYQSWTIQYQLNSTDDLAVKRIELGFGKIGNWFLLTQIGSNSDPYAFRKFLEEVTGVDRKGKEEQEKEKRRKTIKELSNDSNHDTIAIDLEGKGQKEKMLREED